MLRAPKTRSPDLGPLLARTPAPFAALPPAERLAVLRAAAGHGLLAAAAGRLPADDPELARAFERLAAATRLRDARLREGLEAVLAVLRAAGVEPIALKGPVLADRVYPDPSLRPATDLDLLVPLEALDHAAAALVAVGFRRAPALQDAYQREQHHHLHLGREGGPEVELHFRAVSAFGAELPAADLRARALPHRTVRGTPLLVLAPEDELVMLAVHAAVHLLARGGWLLDLALLVERTPGLDWAEVHRRAETWRCRRAVAYTLHHLRALGAAVPDGPHLALGRVRRRLADRLARAALAGSGRGAAVLRMGFRVVLRDSQRTVPRRFLAEARWVVRRRAHRLAGLLGSIRTRGADAEPGPGSQERGDRG